MRRDRRDLDDPQPGAVAAWAETTPTILMSRHCCAWRWSRPG